MKLMCNVEVSNRLCEGNGRRKSKKSCLSIGKLSSSDNELYILLQTLENKQGTKYKLKDNIEIVFTKCIDEGKMTIRLKEPPYDIFIKSDAIQLKSFAHVLKLGHSNKLEASVLSLTDLKAKNLSDALKTKVVVKSAANYPILQGFPRKVMELHLAGLERKSFDRNILKLQHLRVLNLSDNHITSLPKDLGTLPNLQELNLAQNLLFKCPKTKWIWMEQLSVSKHLKLLDLSSNQLKEVPYQLGKLSALVTLRLNTNLIEFLPQSLGCLEALKYLDVSFNQLSNLPGSIRNLKLSTLNISQNNFVGSPNNILINFDFPSLLVLGAKAVYKARIPFDRSVIPQTLVSYMNKTQFCVCGHPCFNNYIRKAVSLSPDRFAASITTSGYSSIPFDCYFCSAQCHRRYAG